MLEWIEHILTSQGFVMFVSLATVIGLMITLYSLRLTLHSVAGSETLIDTSRSTLARIEAIGENSEKTLMELKEVGESLTTHRIAESPNYTTEITKLVSKAKESLHITTIYPTNGIYSAPDSWDDLENALIKCQRIPGFVVSICLSGSREARKNALELQFSAASESGWAEWSSQPPNAVLLPRFARRYRYKHEAFKDFAAFIEFSLDVQDRILEEVYWQAKPDETDQFIPLLSWIIDGSEAIFAIANSNGKSTGFLTRDQNMIDSFESVRKRYALKL